MAGKDLHKEPFDEGTLLKLEIFHKYLKEWLPVFLNWRYGPMPITIADFFAGQGKDADGQLGSPLLILETLMHHRDEILEKKVKIRVLLNELDAGKFRLLQQSVDEYQCPPFEIILENMPFQSCFEKHLGDLESGSNYIFLDQNGIKEITEGIFAKLQSLNRTDILFFISSSYLYRFRSVPEFQKYLDTNRITFEKSDYHSCHRVVFDFYKTQIPLGREYYLAPFSLKKGSNIYGLIFGSNHTYGIEKFLRICWSLDRQRGDANYDIDSDRINPTAPSLFDEYNVPKKVQVFEDELRERLLKSDCQLLQEVYRFGLSRGFLPKHVNKILRDLRGKGKVTFDGSLPSERIHNIDGSKTVKRLWDNRE